MYPLLRRLLIIRWTKWHTLWISVSIYSCPASRCLLSGLMHKVAIVVGMETMHVLNNLEFPYPKFTLPAPLPTG